MVSDDSERTKTAEQSLENDQPHPESQVQLEVGMVLFDRDTPEDDKGLHKIYLGKGFVMGLTGLGMVCWSQSALRNTIANGQIDAIEIDDLSDELRTARLESLRKWVDMCRSSATRDEENGDYESAASERELANDTVELIEAAGEEI